MVPNPAQKQGLVFPPDSQGLGTHPFGAWDENLGQFPTWGVDEPGTRCQATARYSQLFLPLLEKPRFCLPASDRPVWGVTLGCGLESDRSEFWTTVQIFNWRITCTWLEKQNNSEGLNCFFNRPPFHSTWIWSCLPEAMAFNCLGFRFSQFTFLSRSSGLIILPCAGGSSGAWSLSAG